MILRSRSTPRCAASSTISQPRRKAGPRPPGVRVRVPFGRRQMIGILVGIATESMLPAAKLKSALQFWTSEPVLDPVTFDLLRWAAEYYHHPLGEVFAAALPVALRAGQPALHTTEWWVGQRVRATGTVFSQRAARPATASSARLASKSSGRATADEVGEHFKTPPCCVPGGARLGCVAG